MRKVEQRMVQAIKDRESIRVGNDVVTMWPSLSEWHLHGHLIAIYNHRTGSLFLEDAGWRTSTTKSRLNAAAHGLGWGSFKLWQENHEWWWTLDGELNPWNGDLKLFASDKS